MTTTATATTATATTATATVPVKPTTKKAKPPISKGTRRIPAQTAKSIIAKFVMVTPISIDAMTNCKLAAKKLIIDRSGKFTPLGHNAELAMTSVLDSALLDFASGKAIDSKIIIDRAFNAVTNTDKLAGKALCQKVDFTFTKVIDHYNSLNPNKSGFNRYLAKKQYNIATYSNSELKTICTLFDGFLSAVLIDLKQGRKQAKLAYSAEWVKVNAAK